MDALLAILSPANKGRRYGVISAVVLLVVVLAEIEGLAFLALAFVMGEPGLFFSVQSALFPAALFVSAITSTFVLWRASRWESQRKVETVDVDELAESFSTSNWQQRIGINQRS